MKAPKANNSWDLEAIGIIAGLILIICFDVAFMEKDNSSVFITIVAGMGTILNSVLSLMKFQKGRKLTGFCFLALALGMLGWFLARIVLL